MIRRTWNAQFSAFDVRLASHAPDLDDDWAKKENPQDQVDIHEANTHLSRLLKCVLSGEEVIISKSGKPLAKLVPFEKPRKQANPGTGPSPRENRPGFQCSVA